MKKKVFSILICICMLFSMLPMGVMADEPPTPTEYYIDTSVLTDVQTVFDGVADVTEASGVITIVLTSDISGRIEFNNTDGEYVLDLNGKTITPNGANEALCLGNSFNGAVTVTGSGTLIAGVNNIIYKSYFATLNFAVAAGYDYFTLVDGNDEDVFDAENTETKTLGTTYNRGEFLVLTQVVSVPVYEFDAAASVMYSTYIDKTYVGLLVETDEIPDGVTEYGVEAEGAKYPATSNLVGGKYIVDLEGVAAGTDFAAKPYYTYDGNDYYADEFYFTTASARTNVSGFNQTYYANDGDKIAIGYGTKAAGNGGAVDFIGNNGTNWLHSTYNDGGWSYTFGDDGTWVETHGPKVAVYNNSTIQVWVVPTTSFDGNFGIITYYIRNISDSTVTDYKFGSAADIKIGSKDDAPITRTDYGISMTDGTNTFALICNEGYAGIEEPVTTLWFGSYSSAKSNVYNNTTDDSLTNKDSGAAYSWQGITLEPGEIKEYKIELGIGDAATLESLIKPNAAINYQNETISGLTAGSVYIITVGSDEYTITADANGEIAISGTDDNSQDYDLLGNDISLAETKEIGGVIQVSTPQDISVGARPNAVLPEYSTPDDVMPELPDDLDITTTDTSITIKAESGQQYSIDGGISWVVADGDGNVIFTGLDDGTVYNILTRVAATSSSFASEAEGFDVKTSKMLTITDVDIGGEMQTYDGSAKVLTISADGATASYSTTLAGPYSSTFPECVDVGTYTVYYKLSNAGYHDYYNVAELEIIKDEVSAPVIASKIYTGNTLKADVSENEYYTVSENNGGKNVGSYDVVLTLKDSNNYKWADGTTAASNTLQFNITKGDAVISVDTTTINKVYGDSWSLPVATSSLGTVSCNKTVTDMKNVGTYTVTYTVAGTSNYNGDTKSLTVIISPKVVEKPSEDTTVYTYTGAEQTYVVATSDYYTVSGNKRTDAGSQTVTVALKDKTNYVWTDGTTADVTFTFAIDKATATAAAPTAKTGLVYSGSAKALVNAGSTSAGTMKYSLDNSTWSSSVPTATNAGTYTVYYKVEANSNYNVNCEGSVNVTVAKADAVIDVDTTTINKVYGDSWSLPVATSNFGTVSCNKTVVEVENVGTYTVTYTVSGTSNYNGDTKSLTVIISPKAVAKPAEDTTVYTYTGSEQIYIVALSDYYTVSGNKMTNAGSQMVTVALNDKANCVWADGTTDDVTFTFTIAKADPSYTAPVAKAGLVYNGQPQELLVAGSTTDGVMKYAIGGAEATVEVPAMTNAGEYKITCIIEGDANHNNAVVASSVSPIVVNIEKATPVQNPEKLTSAKVRKGKTLAEASVTQGEFFAIDGVTVLDGIVTWVDDTKTITEDTTEAMKFTPVDTNYREVELDVAVDCYTTSGGGASARMYTVKFNSNGGSSIDGQNVSYGAKLKAPADPEKENATFLGWYTDSNLTVKYNFDTPVTSTFILYAKWEEDDGICDGTKADGCPSIEFKDLDTSAWYHLDTDYVIENGLMKGTTTTQFSPDGLLTRAMLVTVLYRNEGEPAVNRSIPFGDLELGHYYVNAVIWAQQNGIVTGVTETEFAPNANITREQFAAIMYRYAIYKGMNAITMEENLHFDDVDEIYEYAISAMNWAVGKGILNGRTATTLNPKENATRAEAAAILHRYIENK